jgi:hypothetical protein
LKLIKKGKYYDFKCKSFLLMILVSPVMFGQAKSDEWHLSANSRENIMELLWQMVK